MNVIFPLVVAALLVGSLTYADTLTDPTRPANAPTRATPTVRGIEPASRLTAIFQSDDRRVAVLDGRVVKVGDRIGDIVIEAILTDSVRYVRAGRVEVVRLPRQAAAVRSVRNDTARNDAGSTNSIRQETKP